MQEDYFMKNMTDEKNKILFGLLTILLGAALFGLMFIAFIPVWHGSSAGFFRAEAAATVMTRKIYSLYDFVRMLFSADYFLGNYSIFAFSTLLTILVSIGLIVFGIVTIIISIIKNSFKKSRQIDCAA